MWDVRYVHTGEIFKNLNHGYVWHRNDVGDIFSDYSMYRNSSVTTEIVQIHLLNILI